MMLSRLKRILAFALSLAIVIFASSLTPLPTKSAPTNNLLAQSSALGSIVFNQPPTPPDKGAPGEQSDSGTRRPCDSSENSNQLLSELVALVPAIKKQISPNSLPETDVWGQTISPHPTLWFYIPASATVAKEAKFVLEDEENYRSEFPLTLPTTPGIVSLPIPTTEPALEIGKWYHWSLKIYCETPASPPPKFAVDGWIKRIEEPLPKPATPEEQIILYAKEGIWFETLTELANLHRTSPSPDTTAAWGKLLEFIGWAQLVKEPILPCCTLEK